MANTYTLISSTVLGSTTASVNISSIPSTYTDLILLISGKTNFNGNDDAALITVNSDNGTNYSTTLLRDFSNTASSVRYSSANYVRGTYHLAGNLASGFSNTEIYFPNYTSTANRPISSYGLYEKNTVADVGLSIAAGLYRGSSAISSIQIAAFGSFLANSSFYLYGIKNS